MEEQWKRKLFRIMKDNQTLGTTASPMSAAIVSNRETERENTDDNSLSQRIDSLQVGERFDVGNGVSCERVRDAEAPGMVDPVLAARNRRPKPGEN